MFVALRGGTSSGWIGKCRVVYAWILNRGAILEGGSDSWGSSEDSGLVDCGLAAYLGAKPIGSACSHHRGWGFWESAGPRDVRQRSVRCHLSGLQGLALFRSSSILTTPSCPFSEARDNGVRRNKSGLSGLTSFRSSSILTIPSCPLQEARKSGVRRNKLGLSGLTSFRSSSILTTSSCPFQEAHHSGVRRNKSALSGSTSFR